MKKSSLLLCLSLVTWLVLAADKVPVPAPKASPLIGTWEFIAPNFRSVKFITPTHFIWVWFDPKTKEISNSMGGRYKHEGDSYIEIIEFGTPENKDYFGKEFKFTVKLEADKWIHTGVNPGGEKLEEIWRRVK